MIPEGFLSPPYVLLAYLLLYPGDRNTFIRNIKNACKMNDVICQEMIIFIVTAVITPGLKN
jgi:hypothetical protein